MMFLKCCFRKYQRGTEGKGPIESLSGPFEGRLESSACRTQPWTCNSWELAPQSQPFLRVPVRLGAGQFGGQTVA